jgi:lipopolysaccharide biosynthesis glycosyltransferase
MNKYPCSLVRLFLSEYLLNESFGNHKIKNISQTHSQVYPIAHTIYLDSDTMVVEDLSKLWHLFSQFSSTQMIGMVEETVLGPSFYNKHWTSIPHPGIHGFNSGVLLLNLVKMHEQQFITSLLLPTMNAFSSPSTFPDQDLLNTLLHNHKGRYFYHVTLLMSVKRLII